jgi:exopolysaccharide biosynthesis predicted pyruvyltransferase EpsI
MSQLDGICQIRGTLLVPGSGAFDQLWHEWLPNTVAKVTNLFQKVIILPSSYDVSVPVVAQCLALPTVYALAREAKSYAAVKYFGRAALFFDCAVYFQEFEKKRNPSGKRRKYGSQLIAFRTDKGSLLPTYGFIPNPELNEDISLTKNNLDDWIYAIEHVGTVVTDRLHIALAAVLLGKQLIFLDSYNMKLSTYFAYTFRDTFDAAITKCSIEWLIENKYVLPVRAYA